jgi:hypothetical protein
LNGHALSIKRGRYVLFLGEICPPKKRTPKPCPVNGTVAPILLNTQNIYVSIQIHVTSLVEQW